MIEVKLTETQQQAVKTILNLRKMTRETGTITTRSQNEFLRQMSSADLAAVANELAKVEQHLN